MKIAIAGYGVEGEENYRYWAADSSNELTIVDEAAELSRPIPEGAATMLGEGAFEKLDSFDMVIRTAGLAPSKIKTNGTIWSATNEFFAQCPAPIIGVTGTKGKGTTASMLEAVFAADGRKVWLVGNIGVAALSVLPAIKPTDCVIFELSSFQLWDIQASPHTAVVLLVEPDHLNVHETMQEYVEAKAGITKFQAPDDICVFHPTNQESDYIASQSKARTRQRYGTPDDGGVYVDGDVFRTKDRIICSTDALQLRGDHNKDNACAALTVALLHGVSDKAIEQGLLNFTGLPHRLEYVKTVNGAAYYNDSFSSAPSATVAAVRAFTEPEILVVGGTDKGADFHELAQAIIAHGKVKEVVIIGDIRQKLHDTLQEYGVTVPLTIFDGRTMPEIVTYLKAIASDGDVVILSPGCASFDMFKNFYDRGDQFRAEVVG